jgi:hypothetical protein
MPADSSSTNRDALVKGNGAFAFDLYAHLRQNEGNFSSRRTALDGPRRCWRQSRALLRIAANQSIGVPYSRHDAAVNSFGRQMRRHVGEPNAFPLVLDLP